MTYQQSTITMKILFLFWGRPRYWSRITIFQHHLYLMPTLRMILPRCLKTVSHFHFYDIFGKSEPILIISSLLNSERIHKRSWTKTTTSPQICCRTTLWTVSDQLHSFTFLLARIIRFMFRQHLFQFLFAYLFFLPDVDMITALFRYFVCCISHSFQLQRQLKSAQSLRETQTCALALYNLIVHSSAAA